METVVRKIGELKGSQRLAAEQLVGHALRDDQQLVIQVVNLPILTAADNAALDSGKLPDWCNVYEGLTDDEIAALEQAVLRRYHATSQQP